MGDSFQPGIIYLSVYVFYQESIYSVLDTHLRVTPGGTVAVYNVTWMFDFFSSPSLSTFISDTKKQGNKKQLIPTPLPLL